MALTVPGTSEPIGSVDYATRAGSADSATYATSAGSATTATTAGTANSATTAGYATSAGSASTATTATNATNATNATEATKSSRLKIYENFYVKEFTISNANSRGSIDITIAGMVPIGIVGWDSGNQLVVLSGQIREGSTHRDGYWSAGSPYSSPRHYLDYWGYTPTFESVSPVGSFRIMYFKDGDQ